MSKIQLYTPYSKQAEVHQACDGKGLFVTVCASRQTGKTMLAQNQILKWALENENATCMWVSPVASQATKVYKAIINAIQGANFIKSHQGKIGESEITFTNGSVIKFRSAQSEDSLRGETVNYMVVDEAAFTKEMVFLEILLPMLSVAGRKCLVVSTPKGRSNWFHKHYMKGVTGKKGYKSFKFNCYTNPYANKEIIKIAKQTLPTNVFRQEYEAEFIDAGTIFENINEVCTLRPQKEPTEGKVYFAGVDLALRLDYTVVSIVDSEGNLVAIERFQLLGAPRVRKRIKEILEKWKPKNTLIEVNGLGQPFFDDLVNEGVKKIQPWTTTNSNKNDIINKLINAFSSKSIKCVNHEAFKNELETFEMKVSPTGKVQFAAASGFNDDIIMATAIAREAQQRQFRNTFNMKIY